MNINFVRDEVSHQLRVWELIRRATEAEDVEQYLRPIRKPDGSVDEKRNDDYRKSAVYYNVAGSTVRGLLGSIFSKEPSLNLPPRLEAMGVNVDGRGNSFEQQAHEVCGSVLRFGRAGLWVDFPVTDGDVSLADLGRFSPTIHSYGPQAIVNWRTRREGSESVLSLVVLSEVETVENDYALEEGEILRELALDEEGYFVRVWRQDGEEWVPGDQVRPRDGRGRPLTRIPFAFVGSENNDEFIDRPPMLDLCRINLAHYQNSADFEDSVYYAGQSQPWMSGATEEVYDLMRKHDFYIGSRKLMPVPSGETFGFANPEPNPLVRQAMTDKMSLMVGLGARFVQSAGAGKTDFEARSDAQAQNSVLATIASNVSAAYTKALEWAALFASETGEAEFELRRDFADFGATPAFLAAWFKGYLDGAVPFSDYVRWLKSQNLVDPSKPDEVVRQELDDEALFGPGGSSNPP